MCSGKCVQERIFESKILSGVWLEQARHHIQEIGLEIVVWICMNQGLTVNYNYFVWFVSVQEIVQEYPE